MMDDRDDHPFGRREYDARLAEMEKKIDKLSRDVEDLVTAWKAAGWVVGVVKWLGGVATAITAIYLLFKGVVK